VNGIRLGGLERIGEGREAEVFALGPDRALRLARAARLGPAIDHEYAALSAAAEAGAPVPAVHERVEVGGRPGLVVERLGSRNLLLEIGSRPWRVPSISRSLGVLHARLHSVAAPPDLPSVHERLAERLESPLVPRELRSRALGLLEGLPRGDRLCHGDFHPGNVLLRSGGEAVAIDWTGASRGDAHADIARSYLIIRFGAVGPDATAAIRVLARVGRRVLWAGYLRSYRRARALEWDGVVRWLPVIAAARLVEDIGEERIRLLKLAQA
jgi:aminoglycoside phosphotransferase (APT) family kinase protein